MASSVNPYGKVNEAEQERLVALRNTRKRLTIIGVSSIVLVAVVVAAVVGVTQSKNGNKSRDTNSNDVPSAIRASCSLTLYPDSCYQSLAPYVKSGKIKPKDIFKLSVQVAIDELSNAYRDFEDGGGLKKLIDNNNIDNMTLAALESCQELVSLALDHLNSSLSFNTNENDKSLLEVFGDFRTWLSSAGTYQQTCIDSFDNATSGMISTFVQQRLKNSTVFTSNSLAMVTELESSMESINGLGEIGKRRRLMMNSFGNLTGVNTFLGRPWKNYSTTVYVQSMLGSFIHPNGWLPWVGTTAPDTIFYGEYQNYGAGAVTKNRVKWKGLKLNLNANQVGKFTVKSFLKGEKWISAADVKFKSGL